jgi:hypothetical protein
MKLGFPLTLTTLLLLSATSAQADVLLIDSIAAAPINSEEGLPRPARGMTMERVRTSFGEPATAHPWVGDPPITRWDYPEYSVFFEYQHVLTSVVHER